MTTDEQVLEYLFRLQSTSTLVNSTSTNNHNVYICLASGFEASCSLRLVSPCLHLPALYSQLHRALNV